MIALDVRIQGLKFANFHIGAKIKLVIQKYKKQKWLLKIQGF